MAARSEKRVALLRGINVGGKNRVSMEVLRTCFEAAGCEHVQSHIQSGNLVFSIGENEVEGLAKRVDTTMQAATGFSVPILIRTVAELAAKVDAMPFDSGDTEASFQIMLLDSTPVGRMLDPKRSPNDQFVLTEDTLYVRYGAGIGRSKLTTAYIDKTLQTISTARNLKTLRALIELAEKS